MSEDYFVSKLKSDEWPRAADPMLICGPTEEDKKARASAIYNLFVVNRIVNLSDTWMLDYGCGEGHIAKISCDEGICCVVGYDPTPQGWDRFESADNLVYTSDRDAVGKYGPYNLVLMYDVLDHTTSPLEILQDAKSLLTPDGVLVVRFHPWSSRHGTHLWSLNKAYAHLVFSDDQLAAMGHKNMPTFKVIHPRETYAEWMRVAGLRVIWENTVYEQAGPIFEHNQPLKDKMLTNFPDHFGYHDIEEVFKDYVLKPI